MDSMVPDDVSIFSWEPIIWANADERGQYLFSISLTCAYCPERDTLIRPSHTACEREEEGNGYIYVGTN
jgi:hypothetical protein